MTNAQAAQPAEHPHGLGDNKGIQFRISTKGAKWLCTLQDRKNYERTKAAHVEGEPAEFTEAAAESAGPSTSTSSSAASTKST